MVAKREKKYPEISSTGITHYSQTEGATLSQDANEDTSNVDLDTVG